jgi:hypothetical protein
MAKRQLSTAKSQILQQLTERYGSVVTRSQIVEFVGETSTPFPHWITNDKTLRLGRGQYNLDVLIQLGGQSSTSVAAGAGESLEGESQDLSTGAEDLGQVAELGSAQ